MMMEEAQDYHSAQSQYGIWLARLNPQIDSSLIEEYYKRPFALTMQLVDDSIDMRQQQQYGQHQQYGQQYDQYGQQPMQQQQQQFSPHIVSVEIARPSTSPPIPRVYSAVDSSKSAVAETSGLTDVLGNLSAGSTSNLATVFSPTDLIGDEDEDSE